MRDSRNAEELFAFLCECRLSSGGATLMELCAEVQAVAMT
jgi:hypothetical protein